MQRFLVKFRGRCDDTPVRATNDGLPEGHIVCSVRLRPIPEGVRC